MNDNGKIIIGLLWGFFGLLIVYYVYKLSKIDINSNSNFVLFGGLGVWSTLVIVFVLITVFILAKVIKI
jgi:TRAP-type C4-dicarboxylate transport system permease small subunit